MQAQGAERTSVRGVLGVPEFRALLSASALSTLGDQVTRIAVAVLVYEQTDSSFFAAATIAVSYLTWLVGGPFLSALADRYPRKRLMIWCDLARALLVTLLVIPDAPLWVVFALLILVGVLAPPFESAKSATLPEVLEGDAFITGNTLLGAVHQGAMVGGFLLGGVLVTLVDPEGALVLDAVTFLLSAVLIARGVRHRPVGEPTGASLASDTREGFSLVWRTPRLRNLLAYGALGSVAMVAPEGLAVPVAALLDGDGSTAGLLTASVPAGFLLGSFLVLRVPIERRDALLPALTAVACLPLLLTPLTRSTALIAFLWALTGLFSTAQLIANASYVQATPRHARGRAFGVAVSVIMATQGLVLLAVGWLAEVVDPRTSVAIAAGAALVLLLPLRLLGGSPESRDNSDEMIFPQAPADLCRSPVG